MGALSTYLSAVDKLVGHVGDTLEELVDRQVERSSAMVTCYPGEGSRYVSSTRVVPCGYRSTLRGCLCVDPAH